MYTLVAESEIFGYLFNSSLTFSRRRCWFNAFLFPASNAILPFPFNPFASSYKSILPNSISSAPQHANLLLFGASPSKHTTWIPRLTALLINGVRIFTSLQKIAIPDTPERLSWSTAWTCSCWFSVYGVCKPITISARYLTQISFAATPPVNADRNVGFDWLFPTRPIVIFSNRLFGQYLKQQSIQNL